MKLVFIVNNDRMVVSLIKFCALIYLWRVFFPSHLVLCIDLLVKYFFLILFCALIYLWSIFFLILFCALIYLWSIFSHLVLCIDLLVKYFFLILFCALIYLWSIFFLILFCALIYLWSFFFFSHLVFPNLPLCSVSHTLVQGWCTGFYYSLIHQ